MLPQHISLGCLESNHSRDTSHFKRDPCCLCLSGLLLALSSGARNQSSHAMRATISGDITLYAHLSCLSHAQSTILPCALTSIPRLDPTSAVWPDFTALLPYCLLPVSPPPPTREPL